MRPENVPNSLARLIFVDSAEEWAATQDGDFDDLVARYILVHVLPEIMKMTLEAYASAVEELTDPEQLLEWKDVPRDIRSWIEEDMVPDLLEYL